MEENIKVPVFSGDNAAEIQLVKAKLEKEGISCVTENSYLGFTGTPTATALKIMVALQDEAKAFTIIDQYLQENPN